MASTAIDGLPPAQEQAIGSLVNESSIRAAKVCGLADRTIYNWLDNPAFKSAYRRARREAFSQAIALTQRHSPVAVDTLVKIMTDPKSTAAVRVSASTALLKFGREGIELEDLAARIETLEATLKEQKR